MCGAPHVLKARDNQTTLTDKLYCTLNINYISSIYPQLQQYVATDLPDGKTLASATNPLVQNLKQHLYINIQIHYK